MEKVLLPSRFTGLARHGTTARCSRRRLLLEEPLLRREEHCSYAGSAPTRLRFQGSITGKSVTIDSVARVIT